MGRRCPAPSSRQRASAAAWSTVVLLATALPAQLATPPAWRAHGPANMSGRIVDIDVDPADHDVWYVASASGGLFKTTNAGTTFTPVFDREATVSLGAVAIAPSSPNVVWVGTGEANARNSVSWGDGVYVSRDGGRSWTHAGLRESFQIGRIAVHPRNPDTVLVAACGRLWGPNPERGVFRTTDGGKTWSHALTVDADTGAVDVRFDPTNPDRAFAATWTRRRDAYDGNHPATRFGPGAGIWRSADGGASWQRLRSGLPEKAAMGRIGLALAPSKPDTVYAVVATEQLGAALAAASNGDDARKFGTRLGGQVHNVQDQQGDGGFETGGVFRSDDGGDTWRRVNSLNPRPYYYSQIHVDPKNPEHVFVLGANYYESKDGGTTFDEVGNHGLHVDFHALWIAPDDPDVMLLGGDGGLARTTDRGDTWRFFKNLPCAQYYRVAVDDREPYRMLGGLQDNGSWVVPTRTRHSDGVRIGDVFNIGWGDGFTALPHPEVDDLVFYTSQYGAIGWRDLRTGTTGGVARPKAEDGESVRYQWDTPYLIDPRDPDVLWIGAHRVVRAEERGAKAEFQSPVLAATDAGAVTALCASTKSKGLLWAGTADGKVWYTRNSGKAWKDVTGEINDLPGPFHVADIECSHTDAGTAWVAFDGHRSDDLGVHLYRTTNFGRTFKALGQGIDHGPVLALQQGAVNEDLLFAGTEFGVFASLDAGETFFPLRGDLPTVAVRDFAIQARERELVAATHGRGIFVLDIAGLEALTKKNLGKDLALLEPVRAVAWVENPHRIAFGDDTFAVPNPPHGTAIHYWLGSKWTGTLELDIADPGGATIRKLDAPREPGLHRVFWNLRRDGDGNRPGPRVGPGTYTVRLRTDKPAVEQRLEVVPDPLAR